MDAAKRGVRVDVLTAARRDPPALKPIRNDVMLKRLLQCEGLTAYEYSDKWLHMKIYQFDNQLFTLGKFIR